MSKVTNAETEQSVSCGFYNSINHDRKYDAIQISKLFDGMFTDGVFESIGDRFMVKAESGNKVKVGTGKCWFNHTWLENDAPLSIDCGDPDLLYDRYDAIMIEVNHKDSVRDSFIKVIHGTPSSNPSNPYPLGDDLFHQRVICYIRRRADSNEIRQADIMNMVGTTATPFVTGVLKPGKLANILDHWQDELDMFTETEESDFNKWYSRMKTLMENSINNTNNWTEEQKNSMLAWTDDQKNSMLAWTDDQKNSMSSWMTNQKNSILSWYKTIREQISENAAANLQMQIDEDEIKKLLMIGFPDGTKTFSDDGTVITSIDSTGRKLVKTFTNEFSTCTTTLFDSEGGELGSLIKNFSSDGKLISSKLLIVPNFNYVDDPQIVSMLESNY